MRHPLDEVPKVKRPEGLHVASVGRRDRRGCSSRRTSSRSPSGPASPTRRATCGCGRSSEDHGFRPETSRVALDGDGLPVGFVTITEDWIDQVGVVPAWRGRGLGAHLVVRSLRALVKAGCDQAWLAVNVDNPAHELYLRLGFEDHGVRARYTQLTAAPKADAKGA